MLKLDIYGLRTQIDFIRPKDEEEVTHLLKFFLKENIKEVDVNLSFKKKEVPQEIGSLLFPCLAEAGIWAMHSGGFHFKGGHLTVGPSECGKSTLSYMAMKNGLLLVSDDITLLRESDNGIEILPFYSIIFLKDKAIIPRPELFKPALLKYLLIPRTNNGPTFIKKMKKKVDLLRRLVPQFLWSYDRRAQKMQKYLLEKLCDYPAFELCWGVDLKENDLRFRKVLDEIIQG